MVMIHCVCAYKGKDPEEVVQKKGNALQWTFFIPAKTTLWGNNFHKQTQLSSYVTCLCNVPWEQEKELITEQGF